MQPVVDLAPEAVVGDRYRLVESLASGATASVWRAVDLERDREVAIKVLRDSGVDPELRTRAEREAKVLEGIEHPNVVRVLDSGSDDERTFMVMELLGGETLSHVLGRRGPIPADEAVGLAIAVADGLGTVHAQGVIHRDVKPSNIVCEDRGPTLVDFGIARNIDATTLTRGLVVGTAAYLSPEQAQGGTLTPACDVYAIGCVLYELLTGQPPFSGGSPVTVALMHVQEPATPPGDLTDVPAAVDAVVMRCLAKDPAARPADGTALAAELRAALSGAPGDETVAIAPVAADGTMVMPVVQVEDDLIDPSPLAPVPPPPARRRPQLSAGLLVALALGALLLFGLVQLLDSDGGNPRTVPDVTNASLTDAVTYLKGAGLEVGVVNQASDAPAGTVIASDPAPGELIADDGTVQLVVSEGPPSEPEPEPVADEETDDGDKPGKGNGKRKGD